MTFQRYPSPGFNQRFNIIIFSCRTDELKHVQIVYSTVQTKRYWKHQDFLNQKQQKQMEQETEEKVLLKLVPQTLSQRTESGLHFFLKEKNCITLAGILYGETFYAM